MCIYIFIIVIVLLDGCTTEENLEMLISLCCVIINIHSYVMSDSTTFVLLLLLRSKAGFLLFPGNMFRLSNLNLKTENLQPITTYGRLAALKFTNSVSII